jgi:hypothetical protein
MVIKNTIKTGFASSYPIETGYAAGDAYNVAFLQEVYVTKEELNGAIRPLALVSLLHELRHLFGQNLRDIVEAGGSLPRKGTARGNALATLQDTSNIIKIFDEHLIDQ